MDRQGILWLGTRDGLAQYDRETGNVTIFRNIPNNQNSISYNRIWSIYEDRTGNIWIGTFAGGINLLPKYGGYFHHYKNCRGKKAV